MHFHGNVYASHYEVFLVLRQTFQFYVFLLIQLDGIVRGDFCLETDTKLSCLLSGVGENIQNSPEMLASLTSGGKCMWTASHFLLHKNRTSFLSPIYTYQSTKHVHTYSC